MHEHVPFQRPSRTSVGTLPYRYHPISSFANLLRQTRKTVCRGLNIEANTYPSTHSCLACCLSAALFPRFQVANLSTKNFNHLSFVTTNMCIATNFSQKVKPFCTCSWKESTKETTLKKHQQQQQNQDRFLKSNSGKGLCVTNFWIYWSSAVHNTTKYQSWLGAYHSISSSGVLRLSMFQVLQCDIKSTGHLKARSLILSFHLDLF